MTKDGAPGNGGAPLRALIVEDSSSDYEYVLAVLRASGRTVISRRVEDAQGMAAALDEAPWDAVISDNKLPRFSATAALALLQQSGRDLPFIIVSGTIGEEAAVQAMQAGADDYLMKVNLKRLGAAVERGIRTAESRRLRRQAERSLRESQASLRALAAHLESVREKERERLARELHDEHGSLLTALKMTLAGLAQRLGTDPESSEAVRQCTQLAESAAQAGRRIALALRPPVLDLGIVETVQWQAREFEKHTGIRCRVTSNVAACDAGHAQTIALFRILQEALTNVAKHAQATEVEVQLFADRSQVTLEIRDNGRGAPANAAPRPDAFGVRGMAERAQVLGGWLELSGSPGQGTTVMAAIPLHRSEDAAAP